jgi:hypothetical protein
MRLILFSLCLAVSLPSSAQPKTVESIKKSVSEKNIRAEIEFLASDALRGRDTGSPELDKAAAYLADMFKSFGLTTVAGADGYYQPVKLERISPATAGQVLLDTSALALGKGWFILSAESKPSVEITGELVYAGWGTQQDVAGKDLKGKIMLTWVGTERENDVLKALGADAQRKRELAVQAGAVAIIEMYNLGGMPWTRVASFSGRPRIAIAAEGSSLTHIAVEKPADDLLSALQNSPRKATIRYQGYSRSEVPAKNVIALLPGKDKKLRDEYVVLSAHYDHVGVRKGPNSPDSIYNGARDNAIGTVALVEAARYFSKNKPSRSLVFLAVTAEEKGLLGSNWYTNYPLIDLRKTVFNLNTDGAGYNDTTLLNVIGLEKTTAEADFLKAGEPFGLKVIGDPVPEQNLWRRSDNYNFARMGVPSVNFCTGLTAFDAEINKYYHQPADEAGSLNFSYLVRYYSALLNAWTAVINAPAAPFWKPGDSQEELGKKLYGRE